MPIDPEQPGGSDDPTRAHDPVDPTRAHDPVDPTRAHDPVDPTRVQPGADPTLAMDPVDRPASRVAPVTDEPLRRRPDEDDRDQKGAWWLWALLAAVLIGIVLFALLQEGDDDDPVGTVDQTASTEPGAVETAPEDTAVEDTTVEAAPEDTAAPEDNAAEDTTTTTAAAGGATAPDGDPGTATSADGTDLFTLIQGDAGDAERLAPHADQDVTGEGVYVLDIVDGEGFWIGSSEQQRIFAHAGGDAAAQVEVGQRIDFDGFLKANPPADSADVHDIPEDQGAELHRQQGHHIELRSLSPA